MWHAQPPEVGGELMHENEMLLLALMVAVAGLSALALVAVRIAWGSPSRT
jgi:hypothetical protein